MDLLLWSDISFLRRCAFNYGLLIMAYAGGKSVISVCKGALKRANRLILHWAVKRPRNLPGFWWFIQATVLLKVVKRDKVFFLGIWKGCQFSREDRKGYLFCEKWYMKGLRGWIPGRRSTVEVLPPPPPERCTVYGRNDSSIATWKTSISWASTVRNLILRRWRGKWSSFILLP